MICILRRSRRSSPSSSVASRVPSKRPCPRSACRAAGCVRPVVVLPQPDSPTSPSVSPRRSSKLTPSTACTRPTWPPKRARRRPGSASRDRGLAAAAASPAHVHRGVVARLELVGVPGTALTWLTCPASTRTARGRPSSARLAAARRRERAARRECAPVGGAPGRAADPRSATSPRAAARPGAAPTSAGRACRGDAGCRRFRPRCRAR